MAHAIYIHGVTGSSPGSHQAQYDALHTGLTDAGVALPAAGDSVFVEWGWNTPAAGQTASLAPAQANLAATIAAAPAPERWGVTQLIMSPIADKIRDLMTTGWADVTYYVSDEGKARTRAAVWGAISQKIQPTTPTDLVIVAHSAGTLIAHDLLYWLYSGARDQDPRLASGRRLSEAAYAGLRNTSYVNTAITVAVKRRTGGGIGTQPAPIPAPPPALKNSVAKVIVPAAESTRHKTTPTSFNS